MQTAVPSSSRNSDTKQPRPSAAPCPGRREQRRDHATTCSGSLAILGYPAPPLRTGRGGRERERKKKREARERTGKCEKKNRKKKNNNVHCDTSKQPRMRVLQERATQAGVHADQTQTWMNRWNPITKRTQRADRIRRRTYRISHDGPPRVLVVVATSRDDKASTLPWPRPGTERKREVSGRCKCCALRPHVQPALTPCITCGFIA